MVGGLGYIVFGVCLRRLLFLFWLLEDVVGGVLVCVVVVVCIWFVWYVVEWLVGAGFSCLSKYLINGSVSVPLLNSKPSMIRARYSCLNLHYYVYSVLIVIE